MVKCYVCGSTNTISDCMTFANEKIKIPITKCLDCLHEEWGKATSVLVDEEYSNEEW